MSEPILEFCERRAREEQAIADSTTNVAAAIVHRRLAAHYAERAEQLRTGRQESIA